MPERPEGCFAQKTPDPLFPRRLRPETVTRLSCYHAGVLGGLLLLGAVGLAGCERPLRIYALADGFQIRVTGGYTFWAPFPYAEAGIDYDFIGLGWLAHQHSEDRWHLIRDGKTLAVGAHAGFRGWKVLPEHKRRLLESGWSVFRRTGAAARFIVGCVRQSDPDPAQSPPRLTGKARLYAPAPWKWQVALTPRFTLDKSADSVVFVCNSSDRRYVRVLAFDSGKRAFIRSGVRQESDTGIWVRFRIRDRRTETELLGRYLHIPFYGGPKNLLELTYCQRG